MPVPKVSGTQSEYMNKCMSWAADEHSEMEQDQRVAMCLTAWRDAKGIPQPTKKAEKAELQRYKEHAYKGYLSRLYNLARKQLASYQTTTNGDNPHYHFFEMDSEGNGTTHGTINTEAGIAEIEPHDHNIKKWKVSSAKGHSHAIDVVMKANKRGRPKKVVCKAPSQSMFKTFEDYHKAMKKYFKKPTRRPMAKGTHISKAFLEKVMSKVLKAIVEKQRGGKPVGTISERKGGRYKKVAPGQWVKVKAEPKMKPKEEPKKEPKKEVSPERQEFKENRKPNEDKIINALADNVNEEGSNEAMLEIVAARNESDPRQASERIARLKNDIESGNIDLGEDTEDIIYNLNILDLSYDNEAELKKEKSNR